MKDPTWDGLRVPGWYMSVTFSVDMLTGTSTGYSSWISWRIWGETIPKCIDYGGDLPVSGFVDTQRTLIGIFLQVEYDARLLI